jgi:DNA repair exonuclease SbcCD nuclease subunit
MIGIIGDLHFKESLGYAEYIKDHRVGEKKKILDFIVEEFSDCDSVVFMGDQLNSRNNTSEVIREFVSFVERFEGKEIFIIKGNHESSPHGRSAIDFMKEINKPNWHIFTEMSDVVKLPDGAKAVFLPYYTKAELEVKTNEGAAKKIVEKLPKGDVLFAHHAISNTFSGEIGTDFFDEPVLPKEKLESKYSLVVAGHIHSPQCDNKTIITGSIFNNEMGETEKYIWKVDAKMGIKQIKLPGRKIFKLENPKIEDIKEINKNNIVKVIITDKNIKIPDLKDDLEKFDAYILVEQYPRERTKYHFEKGGIDFSIDNLLAIYAKEREVDVEILLKGLDMIKK